MKQKKCRACKKPFSPSYSSAQVVCSPSCAIDYGIQQRAKQFRAETNRMRREFNEKDKGYWKERAKRACHAYIRERDAHRGCVSCGITTGKFDAGHYRTRAAASQIMFCEWNIHRQCFQCNSAKSGNITEYRIELIRRVGLNQVEALENNNATYRYTIDDYKDIEEYYKQKKADLLEAG